VIIVVVIMMLLMVITTTTEQWCNDVSCLPWFQCLFLGSELEKFLLAIKDHLDTEVQSLLLFPFGQATFTDAKLRSVAITRYKLCCFYCKALKKKK